MSPLTPKQTTTNTTLKNPTTIKRIRDAPKTSKDYAIAPNDRVFITGKTGSGKSTLVKYLLATAPRLIVIDDKDDMSEKWNLEDYRDTRENKSKISNRDDFRFRLVNNQEDILSVLSLVYSTATKETKSVIIYIDELTGTIPNPKMIPPIYRDIWSRGRSKNIGGWSNTQRPTEIALFFFTEVEHIFMFTLNHDDDRKRIAKVGGKQLMVKPLDKYGFYYYNGNSNEIKYYSKLNI